MKIPSNPLFKLGQVLLTPGAIEALQASGQSAWVFLTRHMKGDSGDLSDEDMPLNDEAAKDGSRILSAFTTSPGGACCSAGVTLTRWILRILSRRKV